MDLQEVSDRLEIRQLMDRYALACDTCDWGLYRSVYTADAIIDYTEFGGPRAGLDLTVEWLGAGLSTYAGLHHNLTTHTCEIEDDTAKAITYWIAYHTRLDGEGGESMMELGGFYKDRLVRQDRWRIAERVDLATWLKAPLPDGREAPAWYGTMDHHKATMLPG
jgi:hypothetical protein